MKTDPATGKPIIEISHSGLNSFASCPKRWAFRKAIITQDSALENSDAADAGTAFHEGMQEYMRSRNTDLAIEALARHHPIDLQKPERASTYSLEACIHTLQHAIENGPSDGQLNVTEYELATFVKDGVEYPATEVGFLVEIEFPKVVFHLRGFIDLVLQHPWSGEFLAVDIKTTTKQAVSHFEAKFKWDWQTTSYGIPLQALLGLTGAFRVGIYGVIMSDREPSVHFPAFERGPIDVESYQFYLLDKCRQIQHYLNLGRFPRHPSNCFTYGRPCYYLQECRAETLHDMQMTINPSQREGEFQGRPFNPVFTARLEAA